MIRYRYLCADDWAPLAVNGADIRHVELSMQACQSVRDWAFRLLRRLSGHGRHRQAVLSRHPCAVYSGIFPGSRRLSTFQAALQVRDSISPTPAYQRSAIWQSEQKIITHSRLAELSGFFPFAQEYGLKMRDEVIPMTGRAGFIGYLIRTGRAFNVDAHLCGELS
jgi:hypothetical protein